MKLMPFCLSVLVWFIMLLFLVSRCSEVRADWMEYSGTSYGWVHASDPWAGKPFNNDPEATTDTVGWGPYFTFARGAEFHLWFGIKQDHITSIGNAYSYSATLLVLRRRPKRRERLFEDIKQWRGL